jgi:hypothetical protein
MGNPLAKRLGFAPFGIHVVWVKVARLAGMGDNVTFGDGPSKRNALFVDDVIIKKSWNNHGTLPLVG